MADNPEGALRFDRRVPEGLVAALEPDGALHGLVDLVRRQEPPDALDLQFRSASGRSDGSATLYVGLTKALDLKVDSRREEFQVVPQSHFGPASDEGWEKPGWTRWTPFEGMQKVASAILDFARETIAATPDTHTQTEGGMQAVLANAHRDEFALIDRESEFGFASTAAKVEFFDAVKGELDSIVAALFQQGNDWARKPKGFGGQLDALALDADGRVLIIEVKPGSATGPLSFTPAQVALYYWLFSKWVEQDEDSARHVLEGMLKQRTAAGLVDREWSVASPIKLVPVIAVGGEVTSPAVANERMRQIQAGLGAARGHWPEPVIWQFSGPDDIRDNVKLGSLS